ncbi:FimD/PapC N-terminal domain-containing protein [Pseudomonas sp. UM16]|uniref:FimD/PapC N-terminal domain-containing protein n=1 Tax=Pseudomonas sp. UM16 TaxID=3158962 RepID=UPI00398FD23F
MDHRKVLATTALYCVAAWANAAEEFQFNSDVLDVKDRENLDLAVFASANFIMPGQYTLLVQVNRDTLSDPAALKTSVNDLGIRVLLGGTALIPNEPREVDVYASTPPVLEAAPVKFTGAALPSTDFTASALFLTFALS